MFDSLISFLFRYKAVLLFYLAIILFLIFKRKRLEIQAKFIVLYRMKWGLKWMERIAQNWREWIILTGYVGVGAGYVGLAFISYLLLKNLYDLITTPTTASGVSLVLPGINVPGLGILPFWYWLISIFIIAVVHEFSHGIVARAHQIPVKNTGIVFLGPIIGAFVEPDERKLQKEKDITQYSVLAAGSFSNILLAIVAFLLLNLLFLPVQHAMIEPRGTGFTFDSYVDETFPFAQAGIIPGTIITGINRKSISNFQEFSEELSYTRPGDTITVHTTEKEIPLVLAANPDHPRKAFLGIKEIRNIVTVKETYQYGIGKRTYSIIEWFTGLESGRPGLLGWLLLLSFGIGLFNLLPLPLVDGGRMAQVFLQKLKGVEKGNKYYAKISFFFLLILLLNLAYPFVSKLF